MDFSKYVNPFRRPQSFSLGPSIRALVDQRRQQQSVDNQASQYATTRHDTQSTNAATFARDNANTAFDTQKGKYDKQLKAIADARAAAQSGHEDVAEALMPSIMALGGQARRNPDGTFYFKEGDAPARGEIDIEGARRNIYGGGSPPGPGAKKNPFEPPAVAGASAAALPPPGVSQSTNQGPPPAGALPSQSVTQPSPAADPPPGAARSVAPPGAVWLPPGMDPGVPPAAPVAPEAPAPGAPPASSPEGAPMPASSATQAAQSGQPGSEQPTGPNPFTPPSLDPYTIDPRYVRQRNKERLSPYLEGVKRATPERFAGRIERLNENVANLGYTPEETIKLTDKMYSEIFGMARGELNAEAQEGRLNLSAERQQAALEEKHRDRGFRIAKERMGMEGVTKTKEKLKLAEGIYDLLDSAHKNPQVANQLIAQLYRMNQGGVMTDADYKYAKEGVLSWLGAVKNFTADKLLKERGGLNPTTVGEMREFVDIALGSHRRAVKKSMESVYRAYQEAKDPVEKQAIRETIISVFGDNPEDIPEDIRPFDPNSSVPTIAPEDEQAEMQRMAAEQGGVVDNIGVAPVPGMPAEPPRAGSPRGTRVPPKPPRKAPSTTAKKDPKQMTDAEIKAELRRLEDEANAP